MVLTLLFVRCILLLLLLRYHRLPFPAPVKMEGRRRTETKPVCWNHSFLFCPFSRSLAIAQVDLINNNPEIKESSPKVPKLSQNEVHEVIQGSVTLLKVKILSEKVILSSRGSALTVGYDLSSETDTKVPAKGKTLIPTDLSIIVPEGTYGRVAPRSGLAWKHSIDMGAGVIDADYRGHLGVILFNYSDVDFEVKVGDRIAQLIIEKIITLDILEVEDLDATIRGAGGFGSTGV
ncbi:Deoxyuridine 5'-triphosphate nucleotidohydrolase [Hibiscus syriacus]|uniref:Deoxyuridine 5'-triphosphate nucleotidohydrolase n=1 Tax=Hibiscus syriacus TaxID=106335 RepID=A0A6A2ZHB5_HIBSY|nr:deoxyuridine 5'-triphosphate nucleotidohydrolase-like [Hibiscus syriacus]KAE8691238.1 Deoxyuridine 5'-triphosphate nucleotidohydrolase [Hibiscus syriacus]